MLHPTWSFWEHGALSTTYLWVTLEIWRFAKVRWWMMMGLVFQLRSVGFLFAQLCEYIHLHLCL